MTCLPPSPDSPTPEDDAADATLTAILAIAIAAVLAGHRSLAAIAERATDAPQPILAALGARHHPLTGTYQPPAEATVRRTPTRIDADALDRVVGSWLASQQPPAEATPTTRRPHQAVAQTSANSPHP